MASLRHMLYLFLSIFAFVSSEITQELFVSTKNCEASCLKTFPSEKSNSVEKLSDACERGCRFFALVNSVASLNVDVVKPAPVITNDVASDPQVQQHKTPSSEPVPSARTNSSKEACQASCMEAYKHTRERYACHEGCANMARETARVEERVRQAMLEEGARELASLAAVGPLLSSMFSQLYSAVGQPRFAVLVSTAEEEDVKAQDIFLLEQPQQQLPDRTIFIHGADTEPDDVLTDPALLRQLESSSSLDISLRLPEQHVRTFPAEPPRHQQPVAVPVDLLGCLSTRSGMPKWLFGVMALVTGVVMFWLCLEPWDRAAILEESVANKTLLVETDEEEEEKIPHEIIPSDMVKVPLEKV